MSSTIQTLTLNYSKLPVSSSTTRQSLPGSCSVNVIPASKDKKFLSSLGNKKIHSLLNDSSKENPISCSQKKMGSENPDIVLKTENGNGRQVSFQIEDPKEKNVSPEIVRSRNSHLLPRHPHLEKFYQDQKVQEPVSKPLLRLKSLKKGTEIYNGKKEVSTKKNTWVPPNKQLQATPRSYISVENLTFEYSDELEDYSQLSDTENIVQPATSRVSEAEGFDSVASSILLDEDLAEKSWVPLEEDEECERKALNLLSSSDKDKASTCIKIKSRVRKNFREISRSHRNIPKCDTDEESEEKSQGHHSGWKKINCPRTLGIRSTRITNYGDPLELNSRNLDELITKPPTPALYF